MHPTDILLLDGESGFALKVVRSLARARRWRVHVLGRDAPPRQPALAWSRHIRSYHRINGAPETEASAYIEAIRGAVQKTGAKLIVPVVEPTALFCIRHRAALEGIASLALLPEENAFTTAIDKGLLAEFMAERGLPHPTTVLPGGDIGRLRFPVLVKPRRLSGGRGIVKVESREALEAELAHRADRDHVCIQEYIDGTDRGCSILARSGRIEACTTQRGITRHGAFAVHAEISMEAAPAVRAVAERLVSALRWSGVANIDFRIDSRTGEALVLEVNGRYWASLLASTAAGVNFPDLACRLALGETVPAVAPQAGRFVQLGMVFKDLLRLQPRAFQRHWNSLGTLLNDPVPELHRYRRGTELCRRLAVT